MALLNKIFNGRRRENKKNLSHQVPFNGESWIPPAFVKDQIRLILFRESDGRGRKLLFDSQSPKKVELLPQPSQIQIPANSLVQRLRRSPTSSTPLKQEAPQTDNKDCTRPKSDAKMLGEMVFGSVAMSFRGTTTKVHTIRNPSQLMMTKVFPAPHPKTDRERAFAASLPGSLVDCVYVRQSDRLERLSSSVGSAEKNISIDFPEWRAHSCHEMECGLRSKSGSTSEGCHLRTTSSLNSLFGTGSDSATSSLTHSGSYHSLQRRWLRCRATSMEFGVPRREEDSVESRMSCNKRLKIGMAVVFSLGELHSVEHKQFQTFFFSHFTLIESYVNKLRIAVDNAYGNRKSFLPLVYEGFEELQRSICDLYTAPRLPKPVWLSMMAYHEQHHIVCLRFMTEMMKLLEQFDTKSTKFFVSTVLTAVLTHHLAWVPTVMPSGVNPSHSYYKKHTAKWLHMLARSHPYNPLWVQLGDLYGAVGSPCKIARTVVVGKKSEVVQRFLYILSYFIRCSEVYENLEHRKQSDKGEESNLVTSAEECPETEKTSCDVCSRSIDDGIGISLGEGDDETVLRPGRRCCDPCRDELNRRSDSGVRNGLIFDVDGSSDGDRVDSGVSVDDGPSSETWMIPVENNEVNNCNDGVKRSGKVVFTVGDKPFMYEESENGGILRPGICNCKLRLRMRKQLSRQIFCEDDGVDGKMGLARTVSVSKNLSAGEKMDKKWIKMTDSDLKKPWICVNSQLKTVTLTDLKGLKEVPEGSSAGDEDNCCDVCRDAAGMRKMLPLMEMTDAADAAGVRIIVGNENRKSYLVNGKIAKTVLALKEGYADNGGVIPILGNDKISRTCLCLEKDWMAKLMEEGGNPDLSLCRSVKKNGSACHCRSLSEDNLPNVVDRPVKERHKSEASLSQRLARKDSGMDGLFRAVELPLPKSEVTQVPNSTNEYFRGFAWSLSSNFTDRYMADFALQGTNDADFGSRLCADLNMGVQNPVLDEVISESVCIVADTDNWTVQVVSNKTSNAGMPVSMSQLVVNTTETLQHLWKLKMSPEFCLMHLEDRLQEIYFKSRLLADYLLHKSTCDIAEVTSSLGLDASDLPLLMAVASTHSPPVTCTYGVPYR